MRHLLALPLIALATTPAAADWQGLKWSSPIENVPSFYTAAAGIEFAVTGHSVDGTLQRIVMVPVGLEQCHFLLETVLGIYGVGAHSEGPNGSLDQWRDEANGNLVYFWSDDGASCSLTYEPLLRPNTPGSL